MLWKKVVIFSSASFRIFPLIRSKPGALFFDVFSIATLIDCFVGRGISCSILKVYFLLVLLANFSK